MGAEHEIAGSDASSMEERPPASPRRFRARALVIVGALGLAIPALTGAVGAITRQAESVRKLEAEIAGLDARFGQAASAYDGARARLDTVRGRITANTAALKQAQIEFKSAQSMLAFRLSAVYRQPQPSGLEMLLRSGSLSDALSGVDVLERVQRHDAGIVTTISAARTKMRKAQVELLADQKVAASESKEANVRLTEVRSIRSARRGVLINARQRLAVMISVEVNRQRRAALVAAQRRVVQRVVQTGGATAPNVPSAPAAPSSGGGGTDVTAALNKIALCESGGNPTAVSPSGLYRGKYQFDPGTWQRLGGAGTDPAAAPVAEQDRIAGILYGQSGAAPWPICGR
jgi:peptidoglycan hydrolase CwlO-like protein